MNTLDGSKVSRYGRLSTVFTPSAPVRQRDLFAGRLEQVLQVTSAINEPGRHVVLYGERGVGKTSLANLLSELMVPLGDRATVLSARVNCTTRDDYKTMWTKMLGQLGIAVPEEWAYGSPDPDDMRTILQGLEQSRILIFDEFDRVEDDESLTLMADTIKALSDHLVESKVVFVGVADSIDQLIGEHESVQRAIDEIPVPRMEVDDLFSLLDTGYQKVGMRIGLDMKSRIARLSEGLPHYAHLLALHAGQRAVLDDRDEVNNADVEAAIGEAIKRHSLLREYQTAIQSPRSESLFAHVLTACALAEKNRLGQFTSGAVREPMSKIMGKPYSIPAFARHLRAFTEIDRGSVLKQEGPERRRTYRFRNPLLQPFVVLTALAENLIPPEYRSEVLGI